MSSTAFDQFAHRITDVTAQLTDRGIPLTAPDPAPAADPTDPWTSSRPLPLDRSTLAWCTAAQMLADHHHTGIDRQVLSADALLRELGVRGLAQLHSDLRNGASVDYRYTRCPYCSGIGEDPTQPTCEEVSCPPGAEFAGHDHLCPVCQGAEHDPQWFVEQQMQALEKLLAHAVEDERPTRSRPGTWLRRRGLRP